MFDVGFTELLLIGIVALVVIGPERLPAVARTAGQWISKLKRFVQGVKTDLASELESGDLKKLIGDQREQINELKTIVNTARKDFEISSREVAKGTKESIEDLESTLKESERLAAGQLTEATAEAELPVDASLSDTSAEIKKNLPAENLASGEIDPVDEGSATAPEDPSLAPVKSSDDMLGTDRNGAESGR